jgi:hypothetical protein
MDQLGFELHGVTMRRWIAQSIAAYLIALDRGQLIT